MSASLDGFTKGLAGTAEDKNSQDISSMKGREGSTCVTGTKSAELTMAAGAISLRAVSWPTGGELILCLGDDPWLTSTKDLMRGCWVEESLSLSQQITKLS